MAELLHATKECAAFSGGLHCPQELTFNYRESDYRTAIGDRLQNGGPATCSRWMPRTILPDARLAEPRWKQWAAATPTARHLRARTSSTSPLMVPALTLPDLIQRDLESFPGLTIIRQHRRQLRMGLERCG
jgi:hypothetical protein